MKKTEAKKLFETEVLPNMRYNDKVALRCAWNDFVEDLYRNGYLTKKQAYEWSNSYDK